MIRYEGGKKFFFPVNGETKSFLTKHDTNLCVRRGIRTQVASSWFCYLLVISLTSDHEVPCRWSDTLPSERFWTPVGEKAHERLTWTSLPPRAAAAAHLMMMNPPRAGHHFSIPRRAVAHRHRPGLGERPRRNRLA